MRSKWRVRLFYDITADCRQPTLLSSYVLSSDIVGYLNFLSMGFKIYINVVFFAIFLE